MIRDYRKSQVLRVMLRCLDKKINKSIELYIYCICSWKYIIKLYETNILSLAQIYDLKENLSNKYFPEISDVESY